MNLPSSTTLPQPRIELKERTSIVAVNVEGLSANSSQSYGWALYQAFQDYLDVLRADENLRRANSVKEVLVRYQDRVNDTRMAIVKFKERSLIISEEQVSQLTSTLSGLQEKRMALQSTSENVKDFVFQLSRDLGVSPTLAGKAFKLQTDAEFRAYLRELNTSAALVAEYSSRWGENHPKVVAQSLRYESAQKALKDRSYRLVGQQSGDLLYSLDLQSSPMREELFGNLVDNFAKLKGMDAEISEIQRSEVTIEDKLKILSREVAELERLEREHRLAEAVYTSAAAKLDAGQSDIFASYPVIQMLSVPTLPGKAKTPDKKIAIVITAMGVLFVTFGLLTLWHRNFFIRLLLKNV